MKKRKSKSSRVLKAERDAAARLILPKRYYKGRDDKAFFEPVCMIRPPENIEELAGYVSVIPQKYIPEGNALMKKLMGLGTEMEQACTDVKKNIKMLGARKCLATSWS